MLVNADYSNKCLTWAHSAASKQSLDMVRPFIYQAKLRLEPWSQPLPLDIAIILLPGILIGWLVRPEDPGNPTGNFHRGKRSNQKPAGDASGTNNYGDATRGCGRRAEEHAQQDKVLPLGCALFTIADPLGTFAR